MSSDIQAKVRRGVRRKQSARHLMGVVSLFLTEYEDSLYPDEVALFQRFMILVQRLGW